MAPAPLSTVRGIHCAYTWSDFASVVLSQTILLSDSSSEDENEDRPCSHEDLQAMLKVHKHQKRHQARYYQNPQLRKYMYYSTGLLSNYDKFPEHHKSIVGPKKKISKEQKKIEKKVKGLCFLVCAKKISMWLDTEEPRCQDVIYY